MSDRTCPLCDRTLEDHCATASCDWLLCLRCSLVFIPNRPGACSAMYLSPEVDDEP